MYHYGETNNRYLIDPVNVTIPTECTCGKYLASFSDQFKLLWGHTCMFQLMALKHAIMWQMDIERSQNIPIRKTVVHVIMAEVQFACAKVTRVQLCCGRNTWFDNQLVLSVP